MVLKAVSLQLNLREDSSAEEVLGNLSRGLTAARAGGARLALLPAFTGLLFLLSEGERLSLDPTRRGVTFGPSLKILLGEKGRTGEASFLEPAAALARQNSLFLGAGTLPVFRDGKMYHRAYLFSPEGKLVGTQDQTHTTPWERSWGLAMGEGVEVWPTEIGRLALLVGSDIWYPEVSRILALLGAEVVLAPVTMPPPYGLWQQLAGLWQEVQQNQFLALESGLSGRLLGQELVGRSAVFAPCEMTAGETGFLGLAASQWEETWRALTRVYPAALEGLPISLPDSASAGKGPSYSEVEVVSADLDLPGREAVVQAYPLLKLLNPSLYRRYLPGIYGKGDARREGR